MVCSNVEDIFKQIQSLRKNYNTITNCFIDYSVLKNKIQSQAIYTYIYNENIYFIEPKDDLKYLYFYCKSIIELQEVDELIKINNIDGTIVINIVIDIRQNIDNYMTVLEKSEFKYYKKYLKKQVVNNNIINYEKSLFIGFAEEVDNYEIFEMLNNTFDKFSDFLPELTEINELIKNNNILIIKPKNEILGFLIFEDKLKTSYLRALCIKKEYRNDGLGYKLLGNYLNIHKERTKILTLWVESTNINALKLYERFGYKDSALENHIFIYNT